jgi:hypothetical protein
MEHSQGDGERCGETDERGEMALDLEARHCYEKNQERQRGPGSREQPGMGGIIALQPGGGEFRRSYKDDCCNRHETGCEDSCEP